MQMTNTIEENKIDTGDKYFYEYNIKYLPGPGRLIESILWDAESKSSSTVF